MAFERAPHLSYADIPIAYVLELGGEEFLGLRDHNGDFQQIDSLKQVPVTDWTPVEMFGPSLGLLKPCTAAILVRDEPIGQIGIAIRDGRPACVSITSTTHPLTGSLLRQIPFASLVRQAAIAHTVRVLRTESGIFGARYVSGGAGFGQLLEDLQTELVTVDERARKRVINESFLKMVAHIYRTALRLGEPPAKHVENMLGPTTPANARRWIAAARREGHLGPAPGRGRAGEVVSQELGASS
jgi:hypothetical protein